MVVLHIKSGTESHFLYETSVKYDISRIITDVTAIYNGRLKVQRLCDEIEELSKHGLTLPTEMQGLLEEQLEELHLTDDYQETHAPSGGAVVSKDPLLKRSGQAPCDSMQEVLIKTVEEAKATISKAQVDAGKCLNQKMIKECLDILRGAVTIVYPMGLPPHEPIKMELENTEQLEGTQAKEVIEESEAQLWFAGKDLKRDKKLCDFVGNNEKSKVIVKITKQGKLPPPREPAMTEEERKAMMMHAYRRQEQLKELRENSDDSYLNSAWADRSNLKKQFHGVNSISWKPS